MYIIDVQGFQHGSNFICKEIAIINVENAWFEHRIVKQPINFEVYTTCFQKQCNWLTENIHGLEWDQTGGEILEYTHLSEFIRKFVDGNCVYVKGYQKKQWLESIIANDIKDLQEENCPALETFQLYLKSFHCNKHLRHNDLNCALENVFFLRNWFIHCKK